jgi:DNA adenine methylase
MRRLLCTKPFLKSAGGKTRMLPELHKHVPLQVGQYIEPFVGGGAMLFSRPWGRAIAGDANEELARTYALIRSDPGEVIRWLEVFAAEYKQAPDATYERIRSRKPEHSIERAARFIFLNKTAFNGLYRVNRKGEFNVPCAGYPNPNICDAVNLWRCSRMMRQSSVVMVSWDFEKTMSLAVRGDFVFCDPPYLGTFDGYTHKGFLEQDHRWLVECAERSVNRGARVVITNVDTPQVRRMWKDGSIRWRFHSVVVRSGIAASAKSRGYRSDLIIFHD